MEILSGFVTSPMMRLLFGMAAAMLILGVVMRFGLRSVVALGYGVYDMMVILFIFTLSICIRGVNANPNDLTNRLFASFYPEWIAPLVDMFDVHNSAGISAGLLLYEAGKLWIMAAVIEALERLFDLLRRVWRSFWAWWLSEATISVIGVFLFTLIWEKLEQSLPMGQLRIAVAALLVIVILAVAVLGLLAVFGPLGALLGSELYGFCLTSLVVVLLTVILAAVVAATGAMARIDAFARQLDAGSGMALAMTGGVALVLWLMWFVMYKLLRDHV